MKNSRENAERWLRDAENTLAQAQKNSASGDYNVGCFLAEQAAQKALKAVLYLEGARKITIHSIAKLLEEISKKHSVFSKLREEGGVLDQYYLSSRYPDAVAEPAIPSEIFIKDQAEAAIQIAKKILNLSKTLF